MSGYNHAYYPSFDNMNVPLWFSKSPSRTYTGSTLPAPWVWFFRVTQMADTWQNQTKKFTNVYTVSFLRYTLVKKKKIKNSSRFLKPFLISSNSAARRGQNIAPSSGWMCTLDWFMALLLIFWQAACTGIASCLSEKHLDQKTLFTLTPQSQTKNQVN